MAVILAPLILGGLLSGITVTTHAGDLILNNSYGYHSFDFSITEPGDTLFSEGYIAIENPTGSVAHISLLLFGGLKEVDRGPTGPRTHTVSDDVVFYAIPDLSWIRLSEREFTIDPGSEYRVSYTVEIPAMEAYESIDGNVTRGFLAYINVRGAATAGTGATIGVNYDYKAFLTFQGEYEEDEEEVALSLLPWMIYVALGVVATVAVFALIKIKRVSHPPPLK